MDPCEQHLIALRGELARRGVRSELDERGIWPRLRIYCPGETPGADFDNNVVASPISDRWCYWWPSAMPIGPVTCLTQAAETIIDELGIEEREDEGGRTNVASLAVGRMLRQARLEMSRPPVPAGPTAGHCLPGGSVCRALAASVVAAARCIPRTVLKIRPARPGGSPCQAPGRRHSGPPRASQPAIQARRTAAGRRHPPPR
jgi:hypothetical protein